MSTRISTGHITRSESPFLHIVQYKFKPFHDLGERAGTRK
jgi:hypothetical protein